MYTLLLPLLLTLTSAAPTTQQQQPQHYQSAPQYNSGHSSGNKQCITQKEAETFIARYNGFLTQRGSNLGDKFATAQALVAEDFVGPYSSSIRSVQGRPGANTPIYTSKGAFIAGVGNGPIRKISETLEVIAACDRVIWYYVQATGSAKYPAWGFAVFDVGRGGKGGEWQVKELRVEFDSLAWALNEGAEVEYRDGREIGDEDEGQDEGKEKKKGKEGGEGKGEEKEEGERKGKENGRD